jgi:hypothetical protein
MKRLEFPAPLAGDERVAALPYSNPVFSIIEMIAVLFSIEIDRD